MPRLLKRFTEGRTYLATLDLLLDFGFGVVWFSVFTTLLACGVSLLITIIGLPILTATLYLARAGGAVERARARLLLGVDIDDPTRTPAKGEGLIQKLIAPFRDRTTWKELFYLWLVQPTLAVVNFTVAVVAWGVPLWAVTLAIYAIAWPSAAPELWSGERLDAWYEVLPITVAGLLLLPFAPLIIQRLAGFDGAAARWGLSASGTHELA